MIYLFIIFSYFTQASPHTLAGSSIVNNPQMSIAFSQLGFKVSSIPAGWIYKIGIDSNSKSIDLGPSDQNLKSVISFRLENVLKKTNLEQYVRQYLRDYNQYGFEVTNLQSNKKNLVPSVIVDLTQKSKKTKSRQMFFIQNEKVIIASCIDDFDNFDKSVIGCNRILATFQWLK